MKPTLSEIQEVLKIFLDSDLQDLRLEIGDVRVAVSRGGAAPTGASAQPFSAPPPRAAAPAAEPAAATPAAASPHARERWVAITAPSLGVFYRQPAPDQPPFVQVGDTVKQDDPVCLIEVMKMYNRVSAPCQGRIAEILVEDGEMVQYGQPLLYVDPA